MGGGGRWRPVVREVVAMPCCAPTYVATAFSNSATFGPCVPQPLLMDSNGARASSSVSAGLVIGMLSFFFASTAIGLSPYTVASDARAFASARRRQSTRRRTPSRREVLALNPRTSSARFGSPTRRGRGAPPGVGRESATPLLPVPPTRRAADQ